MKNKKVPTSTAATEEEREKEDEITTYKILTEIGIDEEEQTLINQQHRNPCLYG